MSAVRAVKISSAVGILLAIYRLENWRLCDSVFEAQSDPGDRSLAPGVRPQRSDLFSPPGKATNMQA